MNGTVARVIRDKGFGFIKGEDGGEYFFHKSELTGVEFDQIRDGHSVTFNKGNGPKGPRAERVVAA